MEYSIRAINVEDCKDIVRMITVSGRECARLRAVQGQHLSLVCVRIQCIQRVRFNVTSCVHAASVPATANSVAAKYEQVNWCFFGFFFVAKIKNWINVESVDGTNNWSQSPLKNNVLQVQIETSNFTRVIWNRHLCWSHRWGSVNTTLTLCYSDDYLICRTGKYVIKSQKKQMRVTKRHFSCMLMKTNDD